MATRSTFVKLGTGASVVGAVFIVLYIILRVAEADVGNMGLLLVLGIVLVIGGILGGVWVTKSDRPRGM